VFWFSKRLVDTALFDLVGELSRFAFGKLCRLINPAIPLDTSLKLKTAINPSDFARTPRSDLIKMPEPHFVQCGFQLWSDTFDLLQIIGAACARSLQRFWLLFA